MEQKINLLSSLLGGPNVSKQIYDVFKSDETQTQTFYAGFENLEAGKLELSVSTFTQEMISSFIKNIPDDATLKIVFEYDH